MGLDCHLGGDLGWMPFKLLPDSHVCEGVTTTHVQNPSFELGCVSRLK